MQSDTTCTVVPGCSEGSKLPQTPRFRAKSYFCNASVCAHRTAVATMPTPVTRISTPRVALIRDRHGSSSAAVAATIRMRTVGILFLVRLVGEPAEKRGEIHDGRAIFNRRDVVDHLAMRRRPVRDRAFREVIFLGKKLDAGRLAVDIDGVADVQAVVRFGGSGLSQLAGESVEVHREALHVHGGLLRRREVRRAKKQ